MIFQNLHPESKIWIYISSDKIDGIIQNNISSLFKEFVENWKSHGEAVNGQLKFIKDNLLVIGADYFPNPSFKLNSTVFLQGGIMKELLIFFNSRKKEIRY